MPVVLTETRENYVLTGRILDVRERAVLFLHGQKKFWIPVSQIIGRRSPWWWLGKSELTLTAWFAETKGMV